MKRHSDKHIKDWILDFKQKSPLSERLMKKELEAAVHAIFGDISEEYVKRITFKNGVLTIYCTSTVFKSEVHARREDLMRRLKSRVPKSNLESIKLF